MRIRLRHRKLARHIAESRLSQNRWAQRLGLSSGHLSLLVNGRRPYPGPRIRRCLMDGLGLTFEELFRVEERRSRRSVRGRAAGPQPHRTGRNHRGGRIGLVTVWQDFVFGLRQLARKPGASVLTVLALALGLGMNVALFSFAQAILLKPLPYPESQNLIAYWGGGWSQAELRELQTRVRSMDTAGYVATDLTYSEGAAPIMVRGASVSSNLLDVLGTTPLLGSRLLAGSDQPGAERMVVLSEGFWRRTLGARPSIIGDRIRFDEESYLVVGVMPETFYFPTREAQCWIPEVIDPRSGTFRGMNYLQLIGRLRPGFDQRRAQSEMDALGPVMRDIFRYLRRFDKFAQSAYGAPLLTSLKEKWTGDVRATLLILTSAVLALLLIASINVGHVTLSRLMSRTREIGVRLALGAGRGRLAVQFFMEAAAPTALGCLLGTVAAWMALPLLRSWAPDDLPRLEAVDIDLGVLSFSLALALATAVALALIPSLAIRRLSPLESLVSSGRTGDGSRRGRLLGDMLVIAQIAAAFVVVVGAGLTLRTFANLKDVEAGFDGSEVAVFSVNPSEQTPQQRVQLYEGLMNRLRRRSEIEAVGAVHSLPLLGQGWMNNIQVRGEEEATDGERPLVYWRLASGDYFEALKIPLVEGRLFTAADTDQGPSVALVSRTLARRLAGGKSPLGMFIKTPTDEEWAQVVGVVGDVRIRGLDQPMEPVLYRPYAQRAIVSILRVVVRSPLPPRRLFDLIRDESQAMPPGMAVYGEMRMEQAVGWAVEGPRLLAFLLSAFGVTALLLGVLGVYGIMSYAVRRRSFEIGVRMALGARRRRVVSMVLAQGLRMMGIGLAVGTAFSWTGGGLISGHLFGVQAHDPWTFVTVLGIFLMAGTMALLAPALRAAGLDPNRALKSE